MDYTEEIIKELKKHGAKGSLNAKTVFATTGIDSLDLMDLIVDLEEKLNITVPDDELANLKTVNDLNNLIKKLIK